jgi:hypothetical protein
MNESSYTLKVAKALTFILVMNKKIYLQNLTDKERVQLAKVEKLILDIEALRIRIEQLRQRYRCLNCSKINCSPHGNSRNTPARISNICSIWSF